MESEYSAIKEYFGTDYLGALRHYRDALLIESDWTQFTDSPLTDSKKNEWMRRSIQNCSQRDDPVDVDRTLVQSDRT